MRRLHYKCIIAILLTSVTMCYSFEVFNSDNSSMLYNLNDLQKSPLEKFQTTRHKDGRTLIEQWEGINLKNWLKDNAYEDFQNIRFESYDNYMVRIHKAELDTISGYIALKKENNLLDSADVRIVFPSQRDMLWVRGVTRIYLEDFKPVPPPDQIFIWDTIKSKLNLVENPEPLVNISGYPIEMVMHKVFHMEEGYVVIVSRDGMKSKLEYPRHLKGAVLETFESGELNLKSPVIPAGMWLKDIVYIQCGPFAVIKYDFLHMLPQLYKSLDWSSLTPSANVIKASPGKMPVKIESLIQPGSAPLTADEWIELP
jgi:hypothetical protein